MLLQHLLEVSARMAGGMLCHRFRGAQYHDLASLITPIRSEINNPVGTTDHIEVVLDHQDGKDIWNLNEGRFKGINIGSHQS